jgi:hypothetical protein
MNNLCAGKLKMMPLGWIRYLDLARAVFRKVALAVWETQQAREERHHLRSRVEYDCNSHIPKKKVRKNMQEFALKKRHAGCTGMFWRPDPTKATKLASNNDWPRDGATLRGDPVVVSGKKWLQVKQVKQAGGDWIDAPAGAFIPFEYENHYYLE